jgi:Protein of unknown function (DUF3592)
MKSIGMLIAAAVFGSLGLFAGYQIVQPMMNWYTARDYGPVQAHVLSAEVRRFESEQRSGSPLITYRAKVRYEYEIDKKNTSGNGSTWRRVRPTAIVIGGITMQSSSVRHVHATPTRQSPYG